MLIFQETSPALDELYHETQELGQSLADVLRGTGELMALEANTEVAVSDVPGVAVLREGLLRLVRGGKDVRFYNRGDFIHNGGAAGFDEFRLHSAFFSELEVFRPQALVGALSGDERTLAAWLELQSKNDQLMQGLLELYAAGAAPEGPEITQYEAGQVIIREGEPAEKVFILIGGAAEVTYGERVVGQIGLDEIFGEISFLMGCSSRATVTATASSVVHEMDQEAFGQLIRCRPQMMIEVARTLAGRVAQLNDRLSGS